MTDAQKIEARQRARRLLTARIPESVLSGVVNTAASYRESCALVSSFERGGTYSKRVQASIERLDGFQRGAL